MLRLRAIKISKWIIPVCTGSPASATAEIENPGKVGTPAAAAETQVSQNIIQIGSAEYILSRKSLIELIGAELVILPTLLIIAQYGVGLAYLLELLLSAFLV